MTARTKMTVEQRNARALKADARLRAAVLVALATTPKGWDTVYNPDRAAALMGNNSIAANRLLTEEGADAAGSALTRKDLRKLLPDDAIAQCLETRRDAVVATGWRFNDVTGRPQDEIDFATRAVERVRASFLRAQWQAVPFGYAVTDVVFEDCTLPGGAERTWPAFAVEMPFEKFTMTRDWRPAYAPRAGETEPVPIEADKLNRKLFCTYRGSTYNNPLGSPLLARCYVPWLLRTHGWDMWAKGLERAGIPFLHGKVKDPLQQMEDGTTLLDFYTRALDAASRGSAIVTDEDGSISPVDASFDPSLFSDFADRLEKRIQMLILGQTLTSDVNGKGSYAAANVHDRVRIDKRDADLQLLQPAMQNLVNSIWSANQFTSAPPEFIFITGADLQESRAARDANLSQSLQRSGLRLSAGYFVRNYDLDKQDVEPIPAPRAAPAVVQPANAATMDELFAATTYATALQTADRIEQAAAAANVQPLPIDKLWSAIRTAKDEATLTAALRELLTPEELAGFAQHVLRVYATATVAGVQGVRGRG